MEGKIFAGLLLGVLVLGALGTRSMISRAMKYTIEETLDHPQRFTRYRHRLWSWMTAYAASLLFTSGPLYVALSKRWPIPPGLTGPLLFFAAAVPGAALIFWLDRYIARRGSPAKRAGRRRLGLPGYRVPVTLHAPPVPVAFAVGNGHQPAPFAFDVDMRDPELVREAARKHWEAIHFAMASGGDVAAAHARQHAFLDEAARRLPPQALAQLQQVYAEESVPQAERMAGIAGRQADKREEQAALRHRTGRNLLIFGAIGAGLMVLRFCSG